MEANDPSPETFRLEQESLHKITKLFERTGAHGHQRCARSEIAGGKHLFPYENSYTREEVIGKPEELNLFVHPEEKRKAIGSLNSSGKLRDVELQVRRKNGRYCRLVRR
jgi:hypothetical protein